MSNLQMDTIPKKAFSFCRWTICILFWLTSILCFFGINWIIFIPSIIMLLSGILTVKRAPLIVLYKVLFDRKKKAETEVVNVNSIRFAHFVGAVFSLIAIICIYILKINIIGYIFIGLLTFLQTIAALGFCSAQKLYECLILGKNCCNLGKKLRGGKCDVR